MGRIRRSPSSCRRSESRLSISRNSYLEFLKIQWGNADILGDIGSFSDRNQYSLEESVQEHVSNKAAIEGPFASSPLARAAQWRVGTTHPPNRRWSTRGAIPLMENEEEARAAALATTAPDLGALLINKDVDDHMRGTLVRLGF